MRGCPAPCGIRHRNVTQKALPGGTRLHENWRVESVADIPRIATPRVPSIRSNRALEKGIKTFFGGNALVAVIVLALITIFLFREGFGFFGQNLANLRLYRTAGLEYVDIIRAQAEEHSTLTR